MKSTLFIGVCIQLTQSFCPFKFFLLPQLASCDDVTFLLDHWFDSWFKSAFLLAIIFTEPQLVHFINPAFMILVQTFERVLKLGVIYWRLRPGFSFFCFCPRGFYSQPLEHIPILSYQTGCNKSRSKTKLFELRLLETLQVLLFVALPLFLTFVECPLRFWDGLRVVSKLSIYFGFQVLLMLPFLLLVLAHFFCKLARADWAPSFFRDNNMLLLSHFFQIFFLLRTIH